MGNGTGHHALNVVVTLMGAVPGVGDVYAEALEALTQPEVRSVMRRLK